MSVPDPLTLDDEAAGISQATGRPLTKRGEATRRRLLEAAEHVFAESGYHEASIVKITERAGFAGFFRFTAEHPALYRVVREAEFVSPETLRLHYTRIVEGYESGLRAAQTVGDVDPALDPSVTAWALMGMGELIGMRFLLWERDADGKPPAELPPTIFDDMMRVIDNALAPRRGDEG